MKTDRTETENAETESAKAAEAEDTAVGSTKTKTSAFGAETADTVFQKSTEKAAWRDGLATASVK